MSYEHCLPRKEGDFDAKKSLVVFRHGQTASVQFDTGVPVKKSINDTTNTPPNTATTHHNTITTTIGSIDQQQHQPHDGDHSMVSVSPPPLSHNTTSTTTDRMKGKFYFGHPMDEIVEGKRLYTRKCLCESRAHIHGRKNVNGSFSDGCDSILIRNQVRLACTPTTSYISIYVPLSHIHSSLI